MGDISYKINAIAKILKERIRTEYNCSPQFISSGVNVGFNINGQEVGRITAKNNNGINIFFYAPGDQRELPVFA